VAEVAKNLGVRNVLEGSVRKSGPRVRIAPQLIDATTGGRLWAERFDRDMADIFAVQPRGEVRIERKRSLGRANGLVIRPKTGHTERP